MKMHYFGHPYLKKDIKIIVRSCIALSATLTIIIRLSYKVALLWASLP